MSTGLWPTTHTLSPQSKGAPHGCHLCNSGGIRSTRASFLRPPAARNSPAAATARADFFAQAISVPPIPGAVQKSLVAARRTWLDRCVDVPLVDPATNSRVHVYGNVHFAPCGGCDGLADLQELIQVVQPTVLALEQPYDVGARAGLPYPEVIRQLTGLFPDDAIHFAGLSDGNSPGLAGSRPESSDSQSRTAAAAMAAAAWGCREEVERLRSLLPGLAQPARVGRDLLDPFEVFGLYGGCDYVTQPGQLVEALSLFGHLPGLEYGALAVAAQQRGVQVCSVDAPLRLQEKWAAQLVADFTLTESDLSRRLQHDLLRAQSFLPADYLGWDLSLAEALRRVERERAEARGRGAASGAASGEGGGSAGEPSLSTVTAFKVSRAVAAATVPYEVSREAFALQAALQPLKFAFFARKAKHLVLQVRDLCQRMSMRQVRVDAGKFQIISGSAGNGGSTEPGRTASSAGNSSGRGEGAPERVALVDISDQPEKVVLAVVGRQYMPYIEELWANGRSVLWHGDVPRTFAPSALEPRGLP